MKCKNKVTGQIYPFKKQVIDHSNFALNSITVYVIDNKGREDKWASDSFHKWWHEI